MVSACGGGSSSAPNTSGDIGNSNVSISPEGQTDKNLEVLKPAYTSPYWVAALEMDEYEQHVTPILKDFDRTIGFSFPDEIPSYDLPGVRNYQAATPAMKVATRKILSEVSKVLDVSFVEVGDENATNVIAIGQSHQVTTFAFSFFPNAYFEAGMDVFIGKEFAQPDFVRSHITNYDYEVLVHELGHALGLKHPFAEHENNEAVLGEFEDNTANTAMSYDTKVSTFDGVFRPFDWMALTKMYGVDPSYKSGNDYYYFSNLQGTFIIDGAGNDTIVASESSRDVHIDLRPGSQSYIGSKSTYISGANQMTISHGSEIENVFSGAGNDTIVATDFDNVISSGPGSDQIFAGAGFDTIRSGIGADIIDLTELEQAIDIVVVDAPSVDLGFDTIFGFDQGVQGDVFELSKVLETVPNFYPLVVPGSVPNLSIDNGIIRLTDLNLENSADVKAAFMQGGAVDSLSLSEASKAIVICADSRETGENQNLFCVERNANEIMVTKLALLQGSTMDVDAWHGDNFGFLS